MSRLRSIEEEWIPKTKLGELVRQGLITLDKIFQNNLIVKEKEIIDILLPQLREDVITIKMIQKMTASGQRSRFKAVVIVGADGFLGVGWEWRMCLWWNSQHSISNRRKMWFS